MKGKTILIGGGSVGFAYAEALQRAMGEDVELVNVDNPFLTEPVPVKPYVIQALPRLNYEYGTPKPTCSKHHEYVQELSKTGNKIFSNWKCRFCDKQL